MRIKKFTAKTLKDGKALIVRELGEDAVILSTRSLRGRDEEEELIEIVAALDENPYKPTKEKLKLPTSPQSSNIEQANADGGSGFMTVASQIYRELGSIKDMISLLSESVQYKYSGVLGPVLAEIYKALRNAGCSETFSLNVTGRIAATGNFKDPANALRLAREAVIRKIEILPPINKLNGHRKIAFIGPTGCGKTSSLIKLAVLTKLLLNPNSLVVSTDTYKVGGAEQLQTFSSVASLSFKAVYSPAELSELIKSEHERDLIFIDTIGRSQQNSQHLLEIGDFLKAAEPDLVFLVQSATASQNNFADVLGKYSRHGANALILTKLDEAAGIGGIIEALSGKSLPLMYIGNGQKIPEDFEPATKESLSTIILPDNIIVNSELKQV